MCILHACIQLSGQNHTGTLERPVMQTSMHPVMQPYMHAAQGLSYPVHSKPTMFQHHTPRSGLQSVQNHHKSVEG